LLRNINAKESRFNICLHTLPEDTVCLMADLVGADLLPANQYTKLHHPLFAVHQLADI
jgi:hypothetical protein